MALTHGHFQFSQPVNDKTHSKKTREVIIQSITSYNRVQKKENDSGRVSSCFGSNECLQGLQMHQV